MNIAKCLSTTFIEQLRWQLLSKTDQRNVYWLYKVSYINCFVSSLKSKFFLQGSLRWRHLKNISDFFRHLSRRTLRILSFLFKSKFHIFLSIVCTEAVLDYQSWISRSSHRRETQAQVFSCEICKFLRTPILKNICERLLLSIPFYWFSTDNMKSVFYVSVWSELFWLAYFFRKFFPQFLLWLLDLQVWSFYLIVVKYRTSAM